MLPNEPLLLKGAFLFPDVALEAGTMFTYLVFPGHTAQTMGKKKGYLNNDVISKVLMQMSHGTIYIS